MIISVHVPKTAGSSFFRALTEQYGERLVQDRNWEPETNHPLLAKLLAAYQFKKKARQVLLDASFEAIDKESENKSVSIFRALQIPFLDLTRSVNFAWKRWHLRSLIKEVENHFDVIHGHFPAEKYYHLFPQARLSIFFRDPIQHTISQYEFLQRRPLHSPNLSEGKKRINASYLVNEKKYSLAEFAALPQVRIFFRKYLSDLPLGSFHFVGLTEDYGTSISLFNAVFASNLQTYHENANPQTELKKLSHYCSPAEAVAVREYLSEAYDIYDLARRRFDQLCRLHL